MMYEIRVTSQKSRGSSSHRFGGPDTYVVVLSIPEGVEAPKINRADSMERRGIKMHYFGEGYSRHTGPRSMLGRALDAAEEFVRQQMQAQQAQGQAVVAQAQQAQQQQAQAQQQQANR